MVLFDGFCNLCNGVVDFILRHDRRGQFYFASLQSKAGREVLQACGLPADYLEAVVLVTGGRCYLGADAALRILRGLGFPWSLLGVLRMTPSPLRQAIYGWIARRRLGWFGRRETCRVPSEAEKSRFLDENFATIGAGVAPTVSVQSFFPKGSP